MRGDYARQYRDLWNRHWWWRSRRHFVLPQVKRIARDHSVDAILDIGCGDGLFFDDLMAIAPTWGLEPDASLISDENPHRDRISVQPFDEAFQPEQPMDLVVMLDVLEHIEDDDDALRHLYSILSPGGHAVLTVPALMMLWSEHDVANHHFRRYVKHTLRDRIQSAGFEIRRLGYYFGWTIGPLMMRRWLKPGETTETDQEYAVPIPGAAVNTLFYGVSRLDHWLAARVPLPLGSSLFAIIRRPDESPR